MKVEEFMEYFKQDIERDSGAFIRNMHQKPFGKDTDKTFCEWVEIFLAWMEYGNNTDCLRYYRHRK